MRFDYLPPYTYYRLFNIRKYFTMFWAGSGLLCVFIAVFANKPSLEIYNNVTTPNEIVITHLNPAISHSDKQYEDKISLPVKSVIVAPVINERIVTTTENTKTKALDLDTKLRLPIKTGHWKTIKVVPGDTLSKIFTSLEISNYSSREILSTTPKEFKLHSLSPGQKLEFLISHNNDLKALKIPITISKTLDIKLTDNGYKYTYKKKETTKKVAYFSNKIKNSFYASGQTIGLSHKTIMQLADIFGCDIDFALDIRKNDQFKLLFEEDYIGGKKVNTGNILMAEFTNQNKTYKAIRFTDPNGNAGYYSPEGYSMKKSFLRTPVEFTRISSRFSASRLHPILHIRRAHKGVDYAAPHGTPVKAAGDGRITFVGNKPGYGNLIQLQHGPKYSTVYGHLSRFASTCKRGYSVKQGQIIGFVGRTGHATGDHLHYEFRVNGVHRDPLSVTLPKSIAIANQYKKAFMQHTRKMVALWSKHEVNYLAANDG